MLQHIEVLLQDQFTVVFAKGITDAVLTDHFHVEDQVPNEAVNGLMMAQGLTMIQG